MIEWAVTIAICGFSVIALVASILCLQVSLRTWRKAAKADAGIDVEAVSPIPFPLRCGCVMQFYGSLNMLISCHPFVSEGEKIYRDKEGFDTHLHAYWNYIQTVQPSSLDQLETTE